MHFFVKYHSYLFFSWKATVFIKQQIQKWCLKNFTLFQVLWVFKAFFFTPIPFLCLTYINHLFSILFSYFLSIFLEFPLSVLYSIVMLKLDWEFCLRNNRFYQKISAYRILLQESAEKKLLENISKSNFFFYLLYTWLKWSVILYKDAEKNCALFEVKFMGGHMWKSGQLTPKTLSKWGFWAF